jgi:hypothetical protein
MFTGPASHNVCSGQCKRIDNSSGHADNISIMKNSGVDRSAQVFPYNIFTYCSICRVDCKFARNKKKILEMPSSNIDGITGYSDYVYTNTTKTHLNRPRYLMTHNCSILLHCVYPNFGILHPSSVVG